MRLLSSIFGIEILAYAVLHIAVKLMTEPHKTTMAEFGLKYSDGPLSALVPAYFASALQLISY